MPPTTGLAPLPDLGQLSYNGCVFSSLFASNLSGRPVPDEAGRTTKVMEWTLTAEGIVTLPAGATSTDSAMNTLRALLDTPGGVLIYRGRGFGNLDLNVPGSANKDLAWGPIPKTLDFRPLGAGRSAMVTWTMTARVWDAPRQANLDPVLQFNQEVTITYDDDAYSTISLRGTLEIAMTRRAASDRSVPDNVDRYRRRWLNLVGNGIDLTRFRVTQREFAISRDMRTMQWSFRLEEQGPMSNPPGIPRARGTFSVRPAKTGAGLMRWICTLRATYTVPKQLPRRLAWVAFYSLLQFRMRYGARSLLPVSTDANQGQANPPNPLALPGVNVGFGGNLLLFAWRRFVSAVQAVQTAQARAQQEPPVFLIDFTFEEGLYAEESRNMSFSASWMLTTDLSHLLLATGLWKYPRANGASGRGAALANEWAISVRNIMGWAGNLANNLDPSQDAIVDFGGV